MYVFKSDVLDKQLNSNKNRVDIKNRLNKIIEKLYRYNSLDDLQKDKDLGFKKYKGLSNNVYGIDIGKSKSSSMTGERLIITIESNFDEKNKILSKNIDGDKAKLSVLLQYYCKHDEQNKKVKEKDISQNNNDFILIQNLSDELNEKEIELLKDGIDLKTKFQQIRSGNYDKSNAVLTIDKYDIIDRFIYNSNSIILKGIAGSGKTEILIRIIHEIYKNSPNSKVLYITMSDNLSNEANKKYLDFYDNNINVDFHSMKSLIRKNSNQNYEFENIKTFNSFVDNYRYKTKNVDYNLKSKIIKFLDNNNIYSVYSEIYGIIFGHMLDNWNRKSDIITFEEYEKLPNDYKNFNDNLFEMYEISKLYLNYLSDNSIKSYNVECMSLINSNKYDKYDYVLIDEIQDMTECQINFLIEMCNDKNHLLLCGDTKQIINPTFFEFGRIEYKLNKENLYYENLRSNFRNSKNISKLINEFNEIRKNKLYSLHQEDLQDEQSKNTSPGSIYLYQGDKNELIEYFSSASDAIIVDAKEMEKIKKLNIDTFNIFTSNECKGLEFENVCVINMLSDNKTIFDKIWNSTKIKDKTLHYNFNLFYVAITRTKTNLVFFEEKQLDLFDNVINSINEIEVVNDVSDIDKLGDKTAIAYYNQALAVFEKGQYQRALKYFEKAKIAENSNEINADEIDKMMLVCDIYINFNSDSDLAYNFEKNKIYDYAYKHYKEINNSKKMALMLLMEDELNSFSNLIEKNNIDIIELYKEEKYYQLYIEKYFDKLNNSTMNIVNDMSNYIYELSNMIDDIRIGVNK